MNPMTTYAPGFRPKAAIAILLACSVAAAIGLLTLPFRCGYSLTAVLGGLVMGGFLVLRLRKKRPNNYWAYAIISLLFFQAIAATYFLPEARYNWSPYLFVFLAISLAVSTGITLLYDRCKGKLG